MRSSSVPLLLATACGLLVNLKPPSVALRASTLRMTSETPRHRLPQEADEAAEEAEEEAADLDGQVDLD